MNKFSIMSMRTLSLLFLLFGLLFVPLNVIAQSPPPATPIDGGLGILLAGGAAYGVRRLIKKR